MHHLDGKEKEAEKGTDAAAADAEAKAEATGLKKALKKGFLYPSKARRKAAKARLGAGASAAEESGPTLTCDASAEWQVIYLFICPCTVTVCESCSQLDSLPLIGLDPVGGRRQHGQRPRGKHCQPATSREHRDLPRPACNMLDAGPRRNSRFRPIGRHQRLERRGGERPGTSSARDLFRLDHRSAAEVRPDKDDGDEGTYTLFVKNVFADGALVLWFSCESCSQFEF